MRNSLENDAPKQGSEKGVILGIVFLSTNLLIILQQTVGRLYSNACIGLRRLMPSVHVWAARPWRLVTGEILSKTFFTKIGGETAVSVRKR